jgi:O-antigen ligase
MCALLVLVATQILQVRRWRRLDWFWVVVFVLPLLVLKTRGPLLWGMLALVIFYLIYKARLRDRVLQAGLLVVIGIGTYVYRSEGVLGWLAPYLVRGSAETTTVLTGRLPLWQVLLPEFEQQPWLGAGFAAFWNPEQVYQVEQITGFPWANAHNGFLDGVLNTGVVGLALLLTCQICAMVVVVRRARRGDPLGWLAFLFLLYYLLQNLTVTLMPQDLEFLFMIIVAILGLMGSQPETHSPTPPTGAPGAARGRVISPR